MTGEPKPPTPDWEKVEPTSEELAAYGILSYEEAVRKGQEIKDVLRKLLEEIENSQLLRDDTRVNISLSEKLRLVIFPSFPIKLCHEDINIVEMTREPQLLEKVTAQNEISTPSPQQLIMSGRLVQSNELRAEFNPLDDHVIYAFEAGLPPGSKHEGGIRLSSHTDEETQVQVLNFEIK